MNNEFSNLLTKFLNIVKIEFGVTTKIISEEVGISPNTFTNWKKNSNHINKHLLKRFYNYLENFKENKKEHLQSNVPLISLIEQLQIQILKECNFTQLKTKEKTDIELLNNRKKYFQINFNNFIEFIKETARLYEFDYETEKSEYFRVQGYQKKEIFDNLVSLNLINKNESGNFSIQKNLAKLLKVSEAQISRWKKGLDYPTKENLKRLGKLCNINSEYPFSLYEISKDRYASMFLKSPYYSMYLQEFEREYLSKIELLIKKTAYSDVLENEIKENCYLIAYENEDIEEVRALIFRDCIILLKKVFEILNCNITFEKWLLKKINSKKVFYYSYKNESIKLRTAKDCYKFAEAVDYGYKVLRNYKNYKERFELVDDFVLDNLSLFSLASYFMFELQSKDEIFSDWLEENLNLFAKENFFREECRNICNSLSIRDQDNNLDYISAYFDQFWKLILYKNSIINNDIRPIDKVFLDISNKTDGIMSSLKLNYVLLEKTIDKISKNKGLFIDSNKLLYRDLIILEDGKELFEEILFNDASLIYQQKIYESGEEFEIVEYLKDLNEKVKNFHSKWRTQYNAVWY
ncbi:helix-turn-helix domain-containing protein [Streptococcus uberis]|uniref:helix-turn-helix domain-containing protein n=1 Tax=Streptococcus uberis TaxID=1349 RepID=UPI0038B47BCC